MKKQLHAGARWFFRVRGYFTFLVLTWILGWILLFPLALATQFNPLNHLFALILSYVIIIIIGSEIYARMSYTRWFYEFAKDNLKLERGIIWKRYSNVPYSRVQNVDIQRGIIARLCGFSTVNIQTAGYSYGPKANRSEGYIPAVNMDEAEKIRDFLMKKISKRNQGL